MPNTIPAMTEVVVSSEYVAPTNAPDGIPASKPPRRAFSLIVIGSSRRLYAGQLREPLAALVDAELHRLIRSRHDRDGVRHDAVARACTCDVVHRDLDHACAEIELVRLIHQALLRQNEPA